MIIPEEIVVHGIHVAAMDEAYENYVADDVNDDTDDGNDDDPNII